MTRATIDGQKYLKRKLETPLTDIEKKKLLNKELVMSHYATDYLFYRILK
tara:strand:- start:929 stop:1078 length:150 start_codon:yes stop_codon:yes gene_type:complete